jgi:DNA-binding transcriptional LysR family regulator
MFCSRPLPVRVDYVPKHDIPVKAAGRANTGPGGTMGAITLDWDKLRIFHAVADAGSLTHAGDTLHLSQSAVSRQIRALEENLNTTLFHRHARGLILTEQGELLFDATRHMTKRLDAAAARIRDSEEEVFGELRVTTTIGFGSLWLAPRLPALYEKYPDLKIDLMLEERLLDLPMREADVAIRMKEPSQADLIRRRLMSINMRLYASPVTSRPTERPRRSTICETTA